MSNLRLVAVGRISATQDEIISDPAFADTWCDGAADAVDAYEDADEREPAIEDDIDWIRHGC